MCGWNQIFLLFQVTPSAIQNNIVSAKKESRGPQTQLYSLHSFEPGAQCGDWLLKVIKCKWLGILSLTYIQQTEAVYELTDFAKSCVATHISEDMDRLTDCVGQCTICVTLQKLKMGTSLESLQNLIFLTLSKSGLQNDLLQLLFYK